METKFIILHPTADDRAWQPVTGRLERRGHAVRELTWPGWTESVEWRRGTMLHALCADARSRLTVSASQEPASQSTAGPVLVGHHAGAWIARMLARDLRAAGVVESRRPRSSRG